MCTTYNGMYVYVYVYVYICIYWVVQEKAQLLTEHRLKIASKNSTKNRATFSQHVLNHIENFQSKRTTIVEMTGA